MSAYKEAMGYLTARLHLTTELSASVMEDIMCGRLEPVQIATFLAALATKKETAKELLGLAQVLRKHAIPVNVNGPLLDTCGTGGSGLDTPNTSTLCGFVLAAHGVKVAKHGNRSSSGRCGSADVLERLGVNIDLEPKAVEQLIEEENIAFMMAPKYHPAMRHAGPVRKAMGIRTSFNFLGPLANPAKVDHQILGVSDKDRAPLIAQTLCELGVHRALVVTGHDGLDEITLTGPTILWHVQNGKVSRDVLRPKELGLTEVKPEAIEGGDAETNLAIFDRVLSGKDDGPIAELVALNAAAGLWIYGLSNSLEAGIRQARQLIRSGRAKTKFEEYRARTQEFLT